ncbi:class I SAM-dependent methyltransferase [Actibacterium lipolyticum]|uniref:Methyltransferase domain-containing protein n=1 Tax=Actibacterium lipolyticum TaxID=1524263 RepID=A0A238KFR4_9RHOB|nr:class I SAM-dependent methyltransferase [Actibacterium lipolyticum]SMX41663.1 hypothetical protein COL8621_01801 [Actibacterium lipolyticum]
MTAFFEVHKDLPREGPGEAADVHWALKRAALRPDAIVCDAGCGPGDDIQALLRHLPAGHLLAVDLHAPFVAQAEARFENEPRVDARVGDMAQLDTQPDAPFDLIWCAGALYFLGVSEGLGVFRKALKENGYVAFSEPAFLTDEPSQAARSFWDGYEPSSEAELRAKVEAAGFKVLGIKTVSDAAWENYYQPMEARIAKLRAGANAELSKALDENQAEAESWRKVKGETGYLLVLAQAV